MDLEIIISQFNTLTEDPKTFLSQNESKSVDIKSLLKTIYDQSQKRSNALPKLMVDNFDTEQIWQQIEVQNTEFMNHANKYITEHVNQKGQSTFQSQSLELPEDTDSSTSNVKEPRDSSGGSSDDSSDEILSLQANSSDSDAENLIKTDFFNMNEMEEFLDSEDKKEMLNRDNQLEIESDDCDGELNTKEIDFFADMSDDNDDSNKNPKYKDFFVKTDEVNENPNKSAKRNKYLKELEMDEDKSIPQDKIDISELSNFDQRQERLKKKISTLENLSVAKKGWQLQGEISAESRPENSLLENVLEFDMSTRPAPVITEETTMRLEDIIRQRIQDRVWDSVQRKDKPVENIRDYKKQLVLDGEKSKLSLAQIYEKDYLHQRENANEGSDDKQPEETPARKEIREMMTAVISKLDALSNYHFTPRLVRPDVRIVTNLAAVSMEEVAPVAASDAALLAPEEVARGRRKGAAPLGHAERTDTDKKRQRRMKKRLQQRTGNAVGKVKGIAQNKYTKEKLLKEKNVEQMTGVGLKSVKSSTAFFEQLQDQVKATIKNKLAEKKKISKTNLQAKRFKL